jgi:hypothetical protein
MLPRCGRLHLSGFIHFDVQCMVAAWILHRAIEIAGESHVLQVECMVTGLRLEARLSRFCLSPFTVNPAFRGLPLYPLFQLVAVIVSATQVLRRPLCACNP